MPKKLTTEEFIQKAKQVHGDRYDYSEFVYGNAHDKTIIICPEHGAFEQTPANHVYKSSGCPVCSSNKKLTKEQFVSRSKEVHGDKYDYSKVDYKNSQTKVTIICPEHGEFHQLPNSHLSGRGCFKCFGSEKKTYHDFLEDSAFVHGDRYSYKEPENFSYSGNIVCVCPKHGEFVKNIKNHIYMKQGCPECSKFKRIENLSMSFDTFIEKANEAHNNKYIYPTTPFEKLTDKLTIICPEHGEFQQQGVYHLKGTGCKECKSNKISVSNTMSSDNFYERCKDIHNSRYEYLGYYTGVKDTIKVWCPEHGEFEQHADNHLRGHGCPKCSGKLFNNETDINNFIESFDIIGKINDRTIINPYELDIVIPDKKLAIEYNGLYWHSELFKDKNYHKMKTDLCEQQGYQLIHIFEDEWLYKRDIVKKMIKHKLGVDDSPRVYARKCGIGLVDKDDKKNFYETNHIQGNCSSSIDLGLFYNDELVACLSFKKMKDYHDLVRYATSYNVVGGFSKLLKHFKSNYDWTKIITFADRRWSQGELYFKNGFEYKGDLKPDYSYVEKYKRFHKFNFRHVNLKKKLKNYDYKLTEHQNCYNHGYYRIYDAGKMKFSLSCNF